VRPSKKAFCPAAGVALLRAASTVKPDGLNQDEEIGYKIVLRACRAPFDPNCSQRPARRRHRLREGSRRQGAFGYNALTAVYEDLVKAGVIDPTKVTRTALQNAASVATLLLTSDALVADKPKKTKPRHAPRRRRRICTKHSVGQTFPVCRGSR